MIYWIFSFAELQRFDGINVAGKPWIRSAETRPRLANGNFEFIIRRGAFHLGFTSFIIFGFSLAHQAFTALWELSFIVCGLTFSMDYR